MKDTRYLGVLGAVALLAAALVVPIVAHDLPLEVLAYVKAEGDRLHVLVRLPPEFLREAGLSVRSDGYLDLRALEATGGPLSAVASDVTRNLDVMQGGQPLPPPRTASTISLVPDASFDSYETALARVAAPRPSAEAMINPSVVWVDVHLDYPIAPLDDRFSIRVNGFRANRPSRMQVRYVTASGVTRTLTTTGTPRRIELEPGWQTVGQMFARLGLERLTGSALPLLFVLALAIPLRPVRTTLAAFGAFAAGCAVALAISTFLPAPPGPSVGFVVQSVAAAVLALAALQNITSPRFAWVRLAAVGFGLAVGFSLGFDYRENAPFGGSHTMLALLAFGGPLLVGWFWLLLVAHPVVGLLHKFAAGLSRSGSRSGVSRFPGPMGSRPVAGPRPSAGASLATHDPLGPGVRGRWAIILLSAIVIHAALHSLVAGQ